MKKHLLLLPFILGIGACAYTPQQLTYAPTVNVEQRIANNDKINVSVEDKRDSQQLGYRSKDNKHDNPITPSNKLSQAIADATQKALNEQGFVISSEEENTQLHIIIESLNYEALDSNSIKLKAVLRSEIKQAEEKFSSRYVTESTHDSLITPSAARNEEMVNDILSKTLQRLFDDPKAQAFLQKSSDANNQ